MRGWLEPFRPSRENPWDFAAAAHLWRRAGFSAPPAQVEASARLAPEEAAAEIARGPAEDPATAELESIYPTVLALGSADALRAWLVARMLRCGHQLREKVALFWHGHFATSILKVRDPVWMARQYRLFLDLGLGPFGRLLEAVTRDPAMIRWLDNDTNRKGHPNENFARELFELFTLGPGNYTEHDIAEAALTGQRIIVVGGSPLAVRAELTLASPPTRRRPEDAQVLETEAQLYSLLAADVHWRSAKG